MKRLESELEAIGGNPNSLGSGKTREQLQAEIEESNSKIESLAHGTSRSRFLYSAFHLLY